MRAFHDSRNIRYRAPYGAIVPGETVSLWLDVSDAPNATAKLRTWADGVGETLYDMHVADTGEEPSGTTRFEVSLTPEDTGIIWYHFIIAEDNGHTLRYGARDGRFGGIGQLRDWEPPSFQLTVNDPAATEQIVNEILDGTNPMMRPPTEMMVGFSDEELQKIPPLVATQTLELAELGVIPPELADRLRRLFPNL